MRLSSAWLIAIPVLAAAITWWPLTGAYFHADDFLHMYVIADGRSLEFLVSPYAGHMLTVWNALALAAHALLGAEPRGYYLLVLALHLVNVAALFAVLRRVAGDVLACFGATVWGTAPYVGASLGWLSVSGHVVLTAFVLAALAGLLATIRAGRAASNREALAWALLLFAGAASFGIGIGIALAGAVALRLLLPGQRSIRLVALGLPLAVIAAYLLTQAAAAAFPQPTPPPPAPPLSLATVTAIIDLFLQLVAAGIAAATAGIIGDAWPVTAVPAIALWIAAVGVGLWRGRADERRLIAALLLLVAGGYGIIALGRGPGLASFGLSVGSAAESARYHYLPGALLIVALCVALSAADAGRRLPDAARAVALTSWLAVMALAAHRAPPPIDRYDDEREQVAAIRALLRQRAAEIAPGAPIYVFNRRLYPLNYIVRAEQFPGSAGAFIATEPANVFERHPVHFIENDEGAIDALRRHPSARAAELLVSRSEYRKALGLPAPASPRAPSAGAPAPASPARQAP